jgi:hypothetical protein
MVGCIALLVHGLLDFNLQIPANAATFAFLAGLASAKPDRDLNQQSRAAQKSGLFQREGIVQL